VGVGTCIGGAALAAGRPQPVTVQAIEDTLVLACPAAVFHELCERHAEFASFFEHRAGRLREAVIRQRQQHATGSDRAVLQSSVGDLVRRAPVTVRADETIVKATRLMSAERISSVMVTDGERLVGILTDRDLRTRVLAAGADSGAPVSTVMTPDPTTSRPDALALEALLELVRRNIHHLPVVEDGRPIGIITATDLLRLQQASPVFLVGDIAKAPDVATVAELATRLQWVVAGVIRQGISAHDAGRVVTTVGDAIEQRMLALAEAELGPPPIPYAWLTLGSRARYEQALGPDQDHALVLHDDYRSQPHGPYFHDLAERVTSGLETVGYPRCRGDKMATNPTWRQPLATWTDHVARWVHAPTPEAVLSASVFFDLRHQYGDPELPRSWPRPSGGRRRAHPSSWHTWRPTRRRSNHHLDSSGAWSWTGPGSTATPSMSSAAVSISSSRSPGCTGWSAARRRPPRSPAWRTPSKRTASARRWPPTSGTRGSSWPTCGCVTRPNRCAPGGRPTTGSTRPESVTSRSGT
jgi:CBS domain-containing protein